MHELTRFSDTIFNEPQLITMDGLDGIVAYLEQRNNGSVKAGQSTANLEDHEFFNYFPKSKIGLINIDGPLTYRTSIVHTLCRLQSYQSLVDSMDKLVNLGATKVVLQFDSPGGEHYACLQTAKALRDLANENGVRLIAYVDGAAGAGAYAIACSAHELIVNPDADVGGIGVAVRLRNSNKALQNAGIEETYLYAGESKIPFDTKGEWKSAFLSDIQSKVDSVYEKLTGYVAEQRGLPISIVVATNGRMMSSKEAIDHGLVDAIMTHTEFESHLAKSLNPTKKEIVKDKANTPTTKQASESTPKTPKRQAGLSESNIEQRRERLRNFDEKSAKHILDASRHLSNERFETSVQAIEEVSGIRSSHE